ncbi:FMN-linked oxidoreductase [Testicularia cyperi]|uniref:FMN-linked oxidoreductase n=1 Tax=Testicularia cyperi TaxID=1882483 RepID=A0A317Y0F5_9BASI|nr:FMN-linked oxidoreductase [Testicularia cyperi]
MSHLEVLKQPVTYPNGVKASNPTLKSAMTERLCTWSDTDFKKRGWPTKEYIQLYKTWGEGGIGTIVLGNIPCDARYPEAKKNACIDPEVGSHEEYVKAYKPVIDAAKAHGSVVLAQVTHAGRQTSEEIVKTPVSSSDLQCAPAMGMTFGKPRPLTVDEIHDIARRFAFAAKVLHEAGADGIELHSAHGYLLSQFLSPKINYLRKDQYGGDLDGRSRIVFEIIDRIRETVPDEKFMIGIKINSADFAEGGFDGEDSFTMSKRLEAAGVALIELSGGTYETSGFEHKKESTVKRESFFIEFAERIRPHLTKARLAVTGGFRSSAAMAKAVEEKSCDIVGLARPLCGEPHLCKELISGQKEKAKSPHEDLPKQIEIAACVVQLHQIGAGETPCDTSTSEGAKFATKIVQSWSEPQHGGEQDQQEKL